MQSIVPTGVHNPNSHTEDEILDALTGRRGVRRISFRYELLTSANVLIQDLDNVLECSIEQNWLADIKRKASFTIQDDGVINFLQDRIKPWIRVHIAPYGDDDWVEWPQGVFLLSSPSRNADPTDTVIRDVEAYDANQVFLDDLVTDRYTVTAGTAYTTAISTLLGSIDKNITFSASTLPTAKDWDPGTSKLKIINELLSAVNYESLSFDENGTAIVKPYVAPSTRAEEYTYADNEDSVIIPQVEQTLDLFSVANRWVLVVSDPDRSVLTSTYTNTDPSSPTSTISRQRTIVDFRTEQDAADQTALDAKAARLAFEASQIYETIEFSTAIMPFHSGNDVYRINYDALAVSAKYSEHTWAMNLEEGTTMKHRARRVVTV